MVGHTLRRVGIGARRSSRMPSLLAGLLLAAAACSPAPTPGPSNAVLASPEVTAGPASTAAAPPTATLSASIVEAVRVELNPRSIIAFGGYLWVATDLGISRVDPKTALMTAIVPIGPGGLVAAGPGGLWAASYIDNVIGRVDQSTGDVLSRISVDGPTAIAVDDHDVWVLRSHARTLERRDATSGALIASIRIDQPYSGPFAAGITLPYVAPPLVAGAGLIWFSTNDGVVTVDPATNQVNGTFAIPNAGHLLAAHGEVWTAMDGGDIRRLDPFSRSATTVFSPPSGFNGYGGLAADGATLWATGDGGIARIDTTTGTSTVLPFPATYLAGIASLAGSLWVASSGLRTADSQVPPDDRIFELKPDGGSSATTVPDPAAGGAASPLKLTRNVPFLDCKVRPDCLLDVYAPQASVAHGRGVVVLFHGAGSACADGCRHYLTSLAAVIAGKGAVVFNTDAETPEDAVCAVRFARANAAAFGGDPQLVIVVGHSHGADIATAIAQAGETLHGACAPGGSGSGVPDALVWLDGNVVPTHLTAHLPIKVRLVGCGGEQCGSGGDLAAAFADHLDQVRRTGVDVQGVYEPWAGHFDVAGDLGSEMPTLSIILKLAGVGS
jgi:streptogramin lyase